MTDPKADRRRARTWTDKDGTVRRRCVSCGYYLELDEFAVVNRNGARSTSCHGCKGTAPSPKYVNRKR